MHLLSAREVPLDAGADPVDLGQSPGDIVLLSAADSEIACLAQARRALGPTFPSVRLASLMRLQHPLSIDLHVERVVARARLVVLRVLGGRGYWGYGLEQVAETCRRNAIPLAALPGDDRPDAEPRRLEHARSRGLPKTVALPRRGRHRQCASSACVTRPR